MAFAHSSRTDANRRQLWGSMIGAHGPLAAPLEVAALQGNRLERRGPTRLGAQMGPSGFLRRGVKYCHNGGMTFVHQFVGPGVQDR
jgi:hypothetical protein